MTHFKDVVDEHLQKLGLLELAQAYPTEVRIPYAEVLKIEKELKAKEHAV